jgi:hypothetical protein
MSQIEDNIIFCVKKSHLDWEWWYATLHTKVVFLTIPQLPKQIQNVAWRADINKSSEHFEIHQLHFLIL